MTTNFCYCVLSSSSVHQITKNRSFSFISPWGTAGPGHLAVENVASRVPNVKIKPIKRWSPSCDSPLVPGAGHLFANRKIALLRNRDKLLAWVRQPAASTDGRQSLLDTNLLPELHTERVSSCEFSNTL